MDQFFKKLTKVLNIALLGLIGLCGVIVVAGALGMRMPQVASTEKEEAQAIQVTDADSYAKDADAGQEQMQKEPEGAARDESDQSNHAKSALSDEDESAQSESAPGKVTGAFDYSMVEPYAGVPYFDINNNIPYFTNDEKVLYPFEYYSNLDELGRCGYTYANVCPELMPTEERGVIGQVRPSGWHTVKYNDIIDGNYLYNRCHLIGYQLTGENANLSNLITGTRYMNVEGMLPFENRVAEYVKSTGNHVLYRVTPIFLQNELVARGVLMEAYSVEDQGSGICFNTFCYNVQPGIDIDYLTGDSAANGLPGTKVDGSIVSEDESVVNPPDEYRYIANKKTGKVHYPECDSVKDMNEKNKYYYNGSLSDLLQDTYDGQHNYVPCKNCNPKDF